MLLVREVCLFDTDHALRLVLDAEEVVIHHPDGQAYGLLLEVHDQAVAVEVALVILVHLDALVTVCALVDNAELLELILYLVFISIARQVGDVDSPVFLNLGLLVRL